MSDSTFDFGMIGLGVMGRNLLLNMADHGFSVSGFDQDPQKIQALTASATPGTSVEGAESLSKMLKLLRRPRKIMMLVPAGKPVDEVIEELLPLLDSGDIVVDGGNSHYTDTLRRVNYLENKGFHFMGMGISGGEKGARTGPSMMPGGDPVAYQEIKTILEVVAAKVGGSPCVAHMGKGAAGHYVKMVHNGIEYAIMQLISEAYQILHHGGGLKNDQLHQVFHQWNQGDLGSYLIEITADIFLQPDELTPNRLVDMILDQAGAKGTGKWTSQDAMDLPVPVPVIDMAVSMREISTYREERKKLSQLYPRTKDLFASAGDDLIQHVHDALFFSIIICYSQGLAQLYQASQVLDMEIPLSEVVRIWRGGCIIRSGLLENFYSCFQKNPGLENLLLEPEIALLIKNKEQGLRQVIIQATQAGYPVAGLMAALSYFDAYRSENLPTNLIQAQRDYFGSHTYQRIDRPGTYHTEWHEFR
ncbi:MAG: NADP-dependent phosphogluconate dehydrogenase [Chitinophagaceae bacterium]